MRYLLLQKRYALDPAIGVKSRRSSRRASVRSFGSLVWEVCKRQAEVLEIPSTRVSASQEILLVHVVRFDQSNITFDTKTRDTLPATDVINHAAHWSPW